MIALLTNVHVGILSRLCGLNVPCVKCTTKLIKSRKKTIHLYHLNIIASFSVNSSFADYQFLKPQTLSVHSTCKDYSPLNRYASVNALQFKARSRKHLQTEI